LTVPVGFEFSNRYNIFLKTGTEVINWLLNGGILQYWHKFEEVKVIEEEEEGPRVLVFDDLSFGFALWLGACGFSIMGFSLEVWWNILKNFYKKNLTLISVFLALRLRLKRLLL
jgi:hypothetical protein